MNNWVTEEPLFPDEYGDWGEKPIDTFTAPSCKIFW